MGLPAGRIIVATAEFEDAASRCGRCSPRRAPRPRPPGSGPARRGRAGPEHERIEVEDTAVAVVKFASGALGVIHGTTAAYPGLDASLRVFGSTGSAVITDDELVFFHANVGDAPEIGMPGRTAEN
ncbi:MAG: hypothetical protein JNM77_09255, partial [Pseudonocardia sp.]|nr:hypothetical protein [Pseudonocardia sp.]